MRSRYKSHRAESVRVGLIALAISVLLADLLPSSSNAQIGVCSVNPTKRSESGSDLTSAQYDDHVTATRDLCQIDLQDWPVAAEILDLSGADQLVIPQGTSTPGTCSTASGNGFFFDNDDGELYYCSATDTWTLLADGGGGGGGSSIVLDLADDASDESTALAEIATTGDTNSVFTEPSADKLLVDLGQNWPAADSAVGIDADGDATFELDLSSSVMGFDPDDDGTDDAVFDLSTNRFGFGTNSPALDFHMIGPTDNINTYLRLENAWSGGNGGVYLLLRNAVRTWMIFNSSAGGFRIEPQVGSYLPFYIHNGNYVQVKYRLRIDDGTNHVQLDLDGDRLYHDADSDATKDAGEGYLGNYLNITDSPVACSTSVEGYMYYDDSLSEPCYCDGTNYQQFDGGGTC